MRPPGKQRLAQRYAIPTTPIQWKVARRGRSSRLVRVDAALVELSVMGAAIVAPVKQVAPVGAQVEVVWEGISGWVVVRRSGPYRGSEDFNIHGVEFCDARSPLGPTMFERLVVEPAEEAAAAAASAPAIWAQPDQPVP